MKLREIISECLRREIVDVNIIGSNDFDIDGLNFCNRQTEMKSCMSFVSNSSYKSLVDAGEHILALLVSKDDVDFYRKTIEKRNGCMIISQEPEIDFYRIHEFLYKETDFYDKMDFAPVIGNNCKIDKTAIVQNGVVIGDNVSVGPLSVIKSGTVIDDNVVIGCNAVIGAEGFQIITQNDMEPINITHVGKCHICPNVYVGDNTSICKSLFDGETYIGQGTKISNMVHIEHNSNIGKNVVITAQVTTCGSVRIEDEVWIAPNSSLLNRVTIGRGAKIGLGSVVTRDVAPNTLVYGNPAKVHE